MDQIHLIWLVIGLYFCARGVVVVFRFARWLYQRLQERAPDKRWTPEVAERFAGIWQLLQGEEIADGG